MAKFLTGKDLSETIKAVCKGKNVCCAVAFWGDGAKKSLFGRGTERSRKARIICDLTMGGTNPEELEKFGAPRSGKVRHLRGVHTKIFYLIRA